MENFVAEIFGKMKRTRKPHSEETKRKIGLANSISCKGQHHSPRTEFKKGNKVNSQTNFDRHDWSSYFQEKLDK